MYLPRTDSYLLVKPFILVKKVEGRSPSSKLLGQYGTYLHQAPFNQTRFKQISQGRA